ncbi:CHAD domain-containing protein [Methylibium sp.]|uniref:CYTH and CHAD domain-containing protein n=1 Tax=Methylibium sp. TaxID=2067992 RepID=UPI00286B94C2|nr:CHAD domain-containing protein [Methylibium sp.]
MSEVELKLQLPSGATARVERELGDAPRRTRMQGLYFDTPDRRLAAAGLALRLRKEGRRWVQTLKGGAAHDIERAEHNVVVAASPGAAPQLDVARHAGTPGGEALAAALGEDGASALLARYRTDISRRVRVLRARRGCVELALDLGFIAARPAGVVDAANASSNAADAVERRWPVCELEVELQGGSPLAVTEVARRLAVRHDLWLDTRSKAERGDRHARGLAADSAVPAVKAQALKLRKGMQASEAWQAVLRNTLAHALPNWSEVAGGHAAPEALHQLRVALRRLRSGQRLFEPWTHLAAMMPSEPVAALFRALGTQRDQDALAAGLQADIDAALAALGEAPLSLSALPEVPPWSDRERATHGLVFFDLIGASMAPCVSAPDLACGGAAPDNVPDNTTVADPALSAGIGERLQHWHAQMRRDAKRFAALDDPARHRLRKRLKRLRYAIEFSAGLFPKRAVARYLERLSVAQERLGEFADLGVAQRAYRALVADEPRAWFAIGWLAEHRTTVLRDCADALGRLRQVKPFWAD